MTTREVILDGGSPWGFRMHGGADVHQPLRISRVNPGSKASMKGIREGDLITSINGQSTKDITNSEAHSLLKSAGDKLKLGLNEDGTGSPKRRHYNKTVLQETHSSETIKRSSVTSTTSYSITSNSCNTANQESAEETSPTSERTNGVDDKGNGGENGVGGITSQRSTLSSSESTHSTNSSDLKGAVTSCDCDAMADNASGNSRSKRRRRANRKRSRKTKISPDNSAEDIKDEKCESDADDTETQAAEEEIITIVNKHVEILENYRVESPKTITAKPVLGTVVKSRSLDDEEMLKITEISESDCDDKSECNSAIIAEADSDIEWESTEALTLKTPSFSLNLQQPSIDLQQPTIQQAIPISPEEEKNLRDFLQTINLITSPQKPSHSHSTNKTETLKAKRRRKREQLAQYFMPVYQNPRFLDAISEESDLSDREHITIEKHGVQIVHTPIVQQDVCYTKNVQSSSRAEIVILEDTTSSNESSQSDEADEGTNKIDGFDLTPPPTPENEKESEIPTKFDENVIVENKNVDVVENIQKVALSHENTQKSVEILNKNCDTIRIKSLASGRNLEKESLAAQIGKLESGLAAKIRNTSLAAETLQIISDKQGSEQIVSIEQISSITSKRSEKSNLTSKYSKATAMKEDSVSTDVKLENSTIDKNLQGSSSENIGNVQDLSSKDLHDNPKKSSDIILQENNTLKKNHQESSSAVPKENATEINSVVPHDIEGKSTLQEVPQTRQEEENEIVPEVAVTTLQTEIIEEIATTSIEDVIEEKSVVIKKEISAATKQPEKSKIDENNETNINSNVIINNNQWQNEEIKLESDEINKTKLHSDTPINLESKESKMDSSETKNVIVEGHQIIHEVKKELHSTTEQTLQLNESKININPKDEAAQNKSNNEIICDSKNLQKSDDKLSDTNLLGEFNQCNIVSNVDTISVNTNQSSGKVINPVSNVENLSTKQTQLDNLGSEIKDTSTAKTELKGKDSINSKMISETNKGILSTAPKDMQEGNETKSLTSKPESCGNQELELNSRLSDDELLLEKIRKKNLDYKKASEETKSKEIIILAEKSKKNESNKPKQQNVHVLSDSMKKYFGLNSKCEKTNENSDQMDKREEPDDKVTEELFENISKDIIIDENMEGNNEEENKENVKIECENEAITTAVTKLSQVLAKTINDNNVMSDLHPEEQDLLRKCETISQLEEHSSSIDNIIESRDNKQEETHDQDLIHDNELKHLENIAKDSFPPFGIVRDFIIDSIEESKEKSESNVKINMKKTYGQVPTEASRIYVDNLNGIQFDNKSTKLEGNLDNKVVFDVRKVYGKKQANDIEIIKQNDVKKQTINFSEKTNINSEITKKDNTEKNVKENIQTDIKFIKQGEIKNVMEETKSESDYLKKLDLGTTTKDVIKETNSAKLLTEISKNKEEIKTSSLETIEEISSLKEKEALSQENLIPITVEDFNKSCKIKSTGAIRKQPKPVKTKEKVKEKQKEFIINVKLEDRPSKTHNCSSYPLEIDVTENIGEHKERVIPIAIEDRAEHLTNMQNQFIYTNANQRNNLIEGQTSINKEHVVSSTFENKNIQEIKHEEHVIPITIEEQNKQPEHVIPIRREEEIEIIPINLTRPQKANERFIPINIEDSEMIKFNNETCQKERTIDVQIENDPNKFIEKQASINLQQNSISENIQKKNEVAKERIIEVKVEGTQKKNGVRKSPKERIIPIKIENGDKSSNSSKKNASGSKNVMDYSKCIQQMSINKKNVSFAENCSNKEMKQTEKSSTAIKEPVFIESIIKSEDHSSLSQQMIKSENQLVKIIPVLKETTKDEKCHTSQSTHVSEESIFKENIIQKDSMKYDFNASSEKHMQQSSQHLNSKNERVIEVQLEDDLNKEKALKKLEGYFFGEELPNTARMKSGNNIKGKNIGISKTNLQLKHQKEHLSIKKEKSGNKQELVCNNIKSNEDKKENEHIIEVKLENNNLSNLKSNETEKCNINVETACKGNKRTTSENKVEKLKNSKGLSKSNQANNIDESVRTKNVKSTEDKKCKEHIIPVKLQTGSSNTVPTRSIPVQKDYSVKNTKFIKKSTTQMNKKEEIKELRNSKISVAQDNKTSNKLGGIKSSKNEVYIHSKTEENSSIHEDLIKSEKSVSNKEDSAKQNGKTEVINENNNTKEDILCKEHIIPIKLESDINEQLKTSSKSEVSEEQLTKIISDSKLSSKVCKATKTHDNISSNNKNKCNTSEEHIIKVELEENNCKEVKNKKISEEEKINLNDNLTQESVTIIKDSVESSKQENVTILEKSELSEVNTNTERTNLTEITKIKENVPSKKIEKDQSLNEEEKKAKARAKIGKVVLKRLQSENEEDLKNGNSVQCDEILKTYVNFIPDLMEGKKGHIPENEDTETKKTECVSKSTLDAQEENKSELEQFDQSFEKVFKEVLEEQEKVINSFNKNEHSDKEAPDEQEKVKNSGVTRESSASSDTSVCTTQCTVKSNPMRSSIADVNSILKESEISDENEEGKINPESLKEICVTKLLSLPFGADILEELAEVSKTLEEFTNQLPKRQFHIPKDGKIQFHTQKVSNSSFTIPADKWVGLATEGDPRTLICLSPTQKEFLEGQKRSPQEADRLLEMHEKFLSRRSYNENFAALPRDEIDGVRLLRGIKEEEDDINVSTQKDKNETNIGYNENVQLNQFLQEKGFLELHEKFLKQRDFNNSKQAFLSKTLKDIKEEIVDHQQLQPNEDENRLLKFLRSNSENPSLGTVNFDDTKRRNSEDRELKRWSSMTLPSEARLKARGLSEWLQLARGGVNLENCKNKKSCSTNNLAEKRAPLLPPRRRSLPHELYIKQMQYLIQKEKEIQEELESLEKEKRDLNAQMYQVQPQRQFQPEDYKISKNGDVAELDESKRAGLYEGNEKFRQIMYEEYMEKVAARAERKHKKVIKISMNEDELEAKKPIDNDLEFEFMTKAKKRMEKQGLHEDAQESEKEEIKEKVLIINGDEIKEAKKLPKHLKEFVDIAQQNEDESMEFLKQIEKGKFGDSAHQNDNEGIWSPGQRHERHDFSGEERNREVAKRDTSKEPIPPIWTPRSAGSSPTAERKEFRPVNFESPVLGRKTRTKSDGSATLTEPPWKNSSGGDEPPVIEKRLPTSFSAPGPGFADTSRLPRAQNPTITLLQKAREGQIPKSAAYIEQERARRKNESPYSSSDIIYQVRTESISDSDSERPRKITVTPRKYEGIGPTTKDGMPITLRSEVRDGNMSQWYKKMYDTIHKQKPKGEDARYPYTTGYLSEPEPGAYDSDATLSDNKFSTLDRRRPVSNKENEYSMSSTLPRSAISSSTISYRPDVQHTTEIYKNQPGRIENYTPGQSSISDKEAKKWWDEVMEIFDGHLEQQKRVPQTKGYMSQALKESGYESDSTLVFRRRDDTAQQLSPLEQKEVYKNIQKGGDVPLHGLRKPAPERPKDDNDVEYYPISREHLRSRDVFAAYKRSAPSILHLPRKPPSPPRRKSSRNNSTLRMISNMKIRSEKSAASGRRHETCFVPTPINTKTSVKFLREKISDKLTPSSSRKLSKSSTKTDTNTRRCCTRSSKPCRSCSLSLPRKTTEISPNTLKERPSSAERTFTRTSKDVCERTSRTSRETSARSSRDISSKNISKRNTSVENKSDHTTQEHLITRKTQLNSTTKKSDDVSKKTERTSNQVNTVSRRIEKSLSQENVISRKSERSSSQENAISKKSEKSYFQENTRKSSITKKSDKNTVSRKPSPSKERLISSGYTFGVAKKNIDEQLPKLHEKRMKEEARKLKSTQLMKPTTSSRLKSVPSTSSLLSYRNISSPVSSVYSERARSSTSLDSLKSSKSLSKSLGNLKQQPKIVKPVTPPKDKKLRKSKKDQLNVEMKKAKCKETKEKEKKITPEDLAKQKELIQTDSFFQHLFLRDSPSPTFSTISSNTSKNSWIYEKTKALQNRINSYIEPTPNALEIYLNHTKPVSDSKFKSLDAMIRSRSASPKSVTWKNCNQVYSNERERSISLPPKIVFSQTSRPITPIVRRKKMQVPEKPEEILGKIILTQTSRPVSPLVRKKKTLEDVKRVPSPAGSEKMYFTETSRPVSPIITRKKIPEVSRSPSPIGSEIMYFSETSRPISPVVRRKKKTHPESPLVRRQNPQERVRSLSPRSSERIYFTETNRPVSPVTRRKLRVDENYRSLSPLTSEKMYFTETSRPVSPLVRRKLIPEEILRSPSPMGSDKLYFSETSRPLSPLVTTRKSIYPECHDYIKRKSPEKIIFTQTSRPVSPVFVKRSKSLSSDDGHKRSSSPKVKTRRRSDAARKMVFSETSRPVSPIIERRSKSLHDESCLSPSWKERNLKESTSIESRRFKQDGRSTSPNIRQRSKKHYDTRSISPELDKHLYERKTVSPRRTKSLHAVRPPSPYFEKHTKNVYDSRGKRIDSSSTPSSPRLKRREETESHSLSYPSSKDLSPIPYRKSFIPSSPKVIRSPSCRKIKSRQNQESKKLKTKENNLEESLIFQSTSSLDSCDFQDNPVDAKYKRFKELNQFYTDLERLGELERTTSTSDLRPRKRNEEEIIDFDRWQEVRKREKAEREMKYLYDQLKEKQKEKDFFFRPKDVESFRWNSSLDRGLRIKEKSVENIKEEFEKKRLNPQWEKMKHELVYERGVYKPLWRGNSVVNLAQVLNERRSQSEGRVASARQKIIDSEKLLTHGIGSRIWSSLSMEQVNLLKNQLTEIYGNDSRFTKEVKPELENNNVNECGIEVTLNKSFSPGNLRVRRNSDSSAAKNVSTPSCSQTDQTLTEVDKKKISQSLSKEVLERQRNKYKTSLSLVLGKETRGAIAAADARVKSLETHSPRTCYSLEMSEDDQRNKENDFVLVLTKDDSDAHKNDVNETLEIWAQPKKPLIKTDALSKVTSMSEVESGSTDGSIRTVISKNENKDERNETVLRKIGSKEKIQEKVDYFEHIQERNVYTPTIYKPAESTYEIGDVYSFDENKEPSLKSESRYLSQSYQDFKDLFGEQEIARMATEPLSASRNIDYTPPPSPKLRSSRKYLYRSRSLSPYYDNLVTRMKNKFENNGEFYIYRCGSKFRKSSSDPQLNQLVHIPGQKNGDVDNLRLKFEYPSKAGRGRSRYRRAGVVSPVYLKAEDRFMPHINIISKIATLYPRKSPSPDKMRSSEELATILDIPVGEVDKLRQRFDSPEKMSLLGQMFTSSPNINELRDIAQYLTGSWTAHKYPKTEDNARSLSSPEQPIRNGSIVRKKLRISRPKSSSPTRKPSILKSKHISPPILVGKSKNSDSSKRVRKCKNGEHVLKPCEAGKVLEVRKSKPCRPPTPTLSRPSVTFKEPEVPPPPPPKGNYECENTDSSPESPRKYVENEVTIHYRTPVRREVKEVLSEDELAKRQADAMRKIYEEERRRKYLQVSHSDNELHDMNSRRHTDNFIPSQKSPIPLNRYDDFLDDLSPRVKPRPRSPEPRLVARALYNFVGQTSRELTFKKGDIIYIRRQVDKNWYEGEINAMIGLFPANYVEIIPYDGIKTTPRKPHEGQARAKYNFIAQTHLELSLAKGELVVVTRRVDDNWFEGKIGGRKGIFPVSYVEVLIDPGEASPAPTKPVASPAAHSLLLNGSAGGKESMGSHNYVPTFPTQDLGMSYRAKPVQITGGGSNYGSLKKSPMDQALHIETQSEPVPYRALYKYRPQNEDELELLEGDTVYVLEKCDDGWYVGSSERTGAFGTFPGNYVERI